MEILIAILSFLIISSVQFSCSVMSNFVTPCTPACQASLSITNSQSLLKLMSIESVVPSNHLILCHPLLLLPSIFPSIRVFSNESVLHIRWSKITQNNCVYLWLYLFHFYIRFLFGAIFVLYLCRFFPFFSYLHVSTFHCTFVSISLPISLLYS